ncbi:hypothetical protein HS121_17830 [bacterium]|nr:hypothetical protein [bacterium]
MALLQHGLPPRCLQLPPHSHPDTDKTLTRTPTRTRTPNPSTPTPSATLQDGCSEGILDGDFEDFNRGNPSWTKYSTNFGSPLFQDSLSAHSGKTFALFGAFEGYEEGSLSQATRIPTGTARLSFFLMIDNSGAKLSDYLKVRIDGHLVASYTAADSPTIMITAWSRSMFPLLCRWCEPLDYFRECCLWKPEWFFFFFPRPGVLARLPIASCHFHTDSFTDRSPVTDPYTDTNPPSPSHLNSNTDFSGFYHRTLVVEPITDCFRRQTP